MNLNYNLILADPPWPQTAYAKGNRSVTNQYDTMTINEICDLPVGDLAAKDCILALWITGPHLDKIPLIMDSWGFKFGGSLFVWLKIAKNVPNNYVYGLGFYTRKNAEFLVYGKRGTPGRPIKALNELVFAPRGKHSAKPYEFYSYLEGMWTHAKRVELFARNNKKGWDAWGNEKNVRYKLSLMEKLGDNRFYDH